MVDGGRRKEGRKGVSNAFSGGYTKECTWAVAYDTLKVKVDTNKVGSHRQGCANSQTSQIHQRGLVPPIPIWIWTLNGRYSLFSSI